MNEDIYSVIPRLIRLRDLLRHGPQDVHSIQTYLQDYYKNDASGKKQLRRDLRNLEALGYSLKRHLRPLRWSIESSAHLLSDHDIHTLVHIREAFSDNHPLAASVTQLMTRLTGHLSDEQRTLWQRQPALRAPLNPAIDYRDCSELIRELERAITQRQQITFLYRARGRSEPMRHERLDPYEIEYTDRHFYLIAFNYRYGSILSFRIDRIVQDKALESPRILPNMQQPRRQQKPIVFTYRLPASFADGGVSERFTIRSVRTDDQYVTVEASDTSEFRIARTLLGYGQHALLLEGPPSLMERMRTTAKLMAEHYDVGTEEEGTAPK
ncbi:MAG TPA: WYL domain-containing protein [Roseiflexaceae bacterium]|nr:WYL domain-containing protein [Roseiflexaceae bacterium]